MERLAPASNARRGRTASDPSRLLSLSLLLGPGFAAIALPFQSAVTLRITVFIAITATLSSLMFWWSFPSAPQRARAIHLLNRLLSVPMVTGLILTAVAILWGGGWWAALTSAYSDRPLVFVPFALLVVFWPPLFAVILLQHSSTQQLRAIVRKAMGILIAFALGWLLLEGLLQWAFDRLPTGLTAEMPQTITRIQHIRFDPVTGAREYPAGEVVNLQIDRQYGDLYYLSCLQPPAQDPFIPYSVTYTRDEHGFRNALPWPSTVDLVVIGDSFVEAEGVRHPFWEGINPSTLALGTAGSSTLEQTALLERYGLPKDPHVVIMTFFEGNDIGENWIFQNAQDRGQTVLESILSYHRWWQFSVTLNAISHASASSTRSKCVYPLIDSRGNEVTFFDYYLAVASIEKSLLTQSSPYALTRQAILTAAQTAREAGAKFVLAFIPSSNHVFWPLLEESGQTLTAAETAYGLVPEATGFVAEPHCSAEQIAARISRNRNSQAELLHTLATQNGFFFLDFTPALEHLAEQGLSPYFTSDTHWNQTGHDSARAMLARFLEQNHLLRSEPNQTPPANPA